MGLLINGEWHNKWYETALNEGRFVRPESRFRHWIENEPGALYKPEAGRYHLYVSLACPWAHRTLIFHKLKGLESLISVSIVDPFMGDHGWGFSEQDGCIPDSVNGKDYLWQIYAEAEPDYTGRVTVPVLWDRQRQTIVNNESSEIIRMFNSSFDALTGSRQDFYPRELRTEIDRINDRVYRDINNGVYRAGFATTQEAYEEAYLELFDALDDMERLLGERVYLAGDRLTEADWRLFPTLLRFDAVYYSHFKCNRQRIADFPNLSNYLRALYQMPGIQETCRLDHIKRHYYASHDLINPTRIVPLGPEIDLLAPHNRPVTYLI